MQSLYKHVVCAMNVFDSSTTTGFSKGILIAAKNKIIKEKIHCYINVTPNKMIQLLISIAGQEDNAYLRMKRSCNGWPIHNIQVDYFILYNKPETLY